MKNKPTPREAELETLIEGLRQLIQTARRAAAGAVNTVQVATSFELGRRIVEHEQQGVRRATYGTQLLKHLSERLTAEFGRGFSSTNLKLMRQFYLECHTRIGQSPPDQSTPVSIGQSPTDQLPSPETQQNASVELIPGRYSDTVSWKSSFTMSWPHYVELLPSELEKLFAQIAETRAAPKAQLMEVFSQ